VKQDLGPIVAEYRGKPISSREISFFYIPASMVSLAMLAYGLWQNYYGYSYYGPAAALEWSQNWLLFAFTTAIVILVILLIRLSVSQRYISLHENGILIRLTPIREQKFPWSTIKGIATSKIQERFFGIYIRDNHKVLLITNQKRPILINQRVENSGELVDKIKKTIYPGLLSELKKDLLANHWLIFGKIAIGNGGIKIKRKYLPWERISSISLQSGFLVVELQSIKQLRLAIKDIYNLELLLHIIDKHIKL
jgi:hypothetical protein